MWLSESKNDPFLPGDITSSTQHATVNALVASLSPIKQSRYFDGELTDRESIFPHTCYIGLTSLRCNSYKYFCDIKVPVTLIQQNKALELVVKKYTKL